MKGIPINSHDLEEYNGKITISSNQLRHTFFVADNPIKYIITKIYPHENKTRYNYDTKDLSYQRKKDLLLSKDEFRFNTK